jgi:hypothetical protein
LGVRNFFHQLLAIKKAIKKYATDAHGDPWIRTEDKDAVTAI